MCRVKAERNLYHEFKIRRKALDCLLVMQSFLYVSGRNDTPAKLLVDYSGCNRQWKADMWRGLALLKTGGFIEEVVKHQGSTWKISDRGVAVLHYFSDKFDHIDDLLINHPSKRWRQGLRPAA